MSHLGHPWLAACGGRQEINWRNSGLSGAAAYCQVGSAYLVILAYLLAISASSLSESVCGVVKTIFLMLESWSDTSLAIA
jgi:hypothetical protein